MKNLHPIRYLLSRIIPMLMSYRTDTTVPTDALESGSAFGVHKFGHNHVERQTTRYWQWREHIWHFRVHSVCFDPQQSRRFGTMRYRYWAMPVHHAQWAWLAVVTEKICQLSGYRVLVRTKHNTWQRAVTAC